jgi:DNA polymerase III subunit gamma/tau
VPASVDVDDPDYAHIRRLAAALTAEEAQLYYQIALHGRDDLRLAPDEQTALMMTFLRLLAFAPSNGQEPVRERVVTASTSATTTPAVAAPARTNAPQASPLPLRERAEGEGASATPKSTVRAEPPNPSPQPSPARGEGAEPAMPQANATAQSPRAPNDQPTPRDFDGDWHSLVQILPLAAVARELARHSALISWDKNLIKLALPQDKRPLATQKERLGNTLSEYFGRALKLEIELTDNAGESVAVRDKQVKDEKQSAAEIAFMADPAVQVLLTEGQGRVRAGSIQTND